MSTFGSQASQETYKASSPSAQDAAGNFTDINAGQGSFSTAEPITSGASFPYAAISVPAVENLVIRDNAIANFGAKPGLGANGIFVLNGEMVDISRNQVLETRDWSEASREAGPTSAAMHGGIVLALVTPPRLPDTTTIFTTMIYEPGLPALRVEENVVRIGLGQALLAIGFGPFAISKNHFSCGGMVRGRDFPIAQTVLILNLGAAIETEDSLKMMDIYNYATQRSTGTNPYVYSGGGLASSAFAASSNGTVLFSDNICQLEARASREPSITSIAIMSVDHLNFTGNHSWVDTVAIDAIFDAVVVAGSVNVTNNRLQESPQSVLVSGLTAGVVNITSQNISTFCLVVDGKPGFTINQSNLALISMGGKDPCSSLNKQQQ